MPTKKTTAKSTKVTKNGQADAAAEHGVAPAGSAGPAGTAVAVDPATRIAALGDLLKKYKDAYYNGHPLVSDAAFDQLEDELRGLDPKHPVLASVGAPVPVKAKPRAAGAPVTEWEKAQDRKSVV